MDDSIYGNPPEALVFFFNLLAKDSKVKKVLELGCGDGRNLLELAKKGFEVTGIDLYGKEIIEARAKKYSVNINFIEADITKYDFGSNKYNALISSEVFNLIEQRFLSNLLTKSKLVLTTGGYIYISILSNIERFFLSTKERFIFDRLPDYSNEQSFEVLKNEFSDWKVIKLDKFHFEWEWPVDKNKIHKYPIEPYYGKGDYVYLIAKKRN